MEPTEERLANFLRRHEHEAFCLECLAAALTTDHQQVREAANAIVLAPHFQYYVVPCARCGREPGGATSVVGLSDHGRAARD